MSRDPRFRMRSHPSLTGFIRSDLEDIFEGGPSFSSVSLPSDSCGDFVGRPIVPSAFSCSTFKGSVLHVDGSGTVPWGPWKWKLVAHQFPITAGTTLDTSPLTAPDGWMLDLVAGTNPSRPVVTPGSLIQDLEELPSMLFQAGNFLRNPAAPTSPRGLASRFLGVKFGWMPLVDDINHLLDIQSYAIKRAKEISQLQSGKGLRRRLKFASDTKNEAREQAFHGIGMSNAYLKYDATVHKESWATIRWFPTVLPPYHPSDEDNLALARRVVLGMTTEGLAKGTWDVLPWTWLIGWFTNIGKYLLIYSNTVPADHGAGCFMSKVVINCQSHGVRYEGDWAQQNYTAHGAYTQVVSTRQVATAITVGANMPFLDMSRLSVLSALFVQRFMR